MRGSGHSVKGQRAENVQVNDLSDVEVPVKVSILSNGPLTHWASLWEFQGGKSLIAELTAIDSKGKRWQNNDFRLTETKKSREGYMKEKGIGLSKIEKEWCLRTSPVQLWQKCEANPVNGTPYHLICNNCQEWLRALFCGVDGKNYRGFGLAPGEFPSTAQNRVVDGDQDIYSAAKPVPASLLAQMGPVVALDSKTKQLSTLVASQQQKLLEAKEIAEQAGLRVMEYTAKAAENTAKAELYAAKLADFQRFDAHPLTALAKAVGKNPVGDSAAYASKLQTAKELATHSAELDTQMAALCATEQSQWAAVASNGGELNTTVAGSSYTAGALFGKACAVVSIGFSIVEVWSAVDDLANGRDPAITPCEALIKALEGKTQEVEKRTGTGALGCYLNILQERTQVIEALSATVGWHHLRYNGARAGGALATIGGGAVVLAGVAGPAAPLLGAAGFALSSGASIGNSVGGYKFRSEIMNTYEVVMEAEREYLSRDCPGPHPLLGKPCVFKFRGCGACQLVMTVAYTNWSGARVQKASCDRPGFDSWYEGYVYVEPGASNVSVTFDSRSGYEICAVNRYDAERPWVVPTKREQFEYKLSDGLHHMFELNGLAKWCYVAKESELPLSDEEVKALTPRLPK